MLVDDEEMLLATGRRILEHLDYEVEAFIDAPTAFNAFEADPGRWDAVLTDLSMPAMTGLDFARRILEVAPGMPVILISGYLGPMDVEEYRKRGFRDVLQKPLAVGDLGQALARVFHLET